MNIKHRWHNCYHDPVVFNTMKIISHKGVYDDFISLRCSPHMNTPRVKISDSQLEDESNHKLKHCIVQMAVFTNASITLFKTKRQNQVSYSLFPRRKCVSRRARFVQWYINYEIIITHVANQWAGLFYGKLKCTEFVLQCYLPVLVFDQTKSDILTGVEQVQYLTHSHVILLKVKCLTIDQYQLSFAVLQRCSRLSHILQTLVNILFCYSPQQKSYNFKCIVFSAKEMQE